jgi:hypothetical protein
MSIQPPGMGKATKPRKRLVVAYKRADGTMGKAIGRYGDTLRALVIAGEKGVTPLERPAPRWSHYVHILRREHDLAIETVTECHGGDFPGTHGRYVLREEIKLLNFNNTKTTKPATVAPGRASKSMATCRKTREHKDET